MRFRDRLFIVGIFLILVPVGLVTGIFSYVMGTSLTADAGVLVRTKLDLLENRIVASHDVLERAGIADNEYYSGAALASIASAFSGAMTSGESFLILDDEGKVLEGGRKEKGKRLDPKDPLSAALASSAGRSSAGIGASDIMRIMRSPSFPESSGASIVAWKRFTPWGLTLVVASDEARAFAPLQSAMRLSLAIVSILLGLAGAVLFFLSQRVSKPLTRLASFAKSLGEGVHGLTVPERGSDEIGILARRFNEMARKMDALTTGLEASVAERTIELSAANHRLHEVNDDLSSTLDRVERMREQLVESEKLVALGQLVAGIAHELNTPLGAASMGAETLKGIVSSLPLHLELLAALPQAERAEIFRAVLARAEETPRSTNRAGRAETAERLAGALRARGAAAADYAADLLVEAGWGVEALPESLDGPGLEAFALALCDLAGLARSATIVSAATDQAVRVIDALRTYARRDLRQVLVPVDVVATLEQVLTLFSSKIKLGIEVVRNFERLPTIPGSPEKLTQVWTNLVSNALHAMSYRGRLEVSARRADETVVVSIADSGPGIPAELRDHIFTPFFTTKPPGEGTGLGLEISRRIVEDLGGGIEFESRPGETVFRVILPVSQGAPRPNVEESLILKPDPPH